MLFYSKIYNTILVLRPKLHLHKCSVIQTIHFRHFFFLSLSPTNTINVRARAVPCSYPVYRMHTSEATAAALAHSQLSGQYFVRGKTALSIFQCEKHLSGFSKLILLQFFRSELPLFPLLCARYTLFHSIPKTLSRFLPFHWLLVIYLSLT